jgi:succinate dehydrogenase/fumarate reductase flavoprotein subunit
MNFRHIGLAARVFGALVATAAALPALALDCPEPPKQQQKDWDTTVRAEVGRIGPVRGAELETRVASVTRDLLTKLPNADRLYLEQMMFSAYCSALRDDRTLDESAKARQVLDYRRELQKSLRP